MCVSYRKLNGINQPYKLPIPRLGGDKITVGAGLKKFIVSRDSRQGYHQISVRNFDRGKLAFFAP